MGFLIPGRKELYGLREFGSRGTVQLWVGHYDIVLYDIRKAVSLLLAGNPNILGILWLRDQHYLQLSPWGRHLIQNRHWFAAKHVFEAFAGYALSQLKRMESQDPAELREYLAVTAELKRRGAHPNHKGEVIAPPPDLPASYAAWGLDKLLQRLKSYQKKGLNLGYLGDKRKTLVLHHGYDTKNAAHLIRLLRMCIEFLESGQLQVFRTRDVDELLAIKCGQWPLAHVKQLAAELFAQAAPSHATSPLPAQPPTAAAEAWLLDVLSTPQ
ncbi:MAG: nucleotidyltransferase domain-containing protein [Bryobacterales bacterium]|nr:nucleotidyltransferase domain-containing protein [Bryobacterales bacterium]